MSALASLPPLQILSDAGSAAALLEPVRLRLIQELSEPGSASSLARKLGEPRQRLNYHLRELEKAGLVRLVEERRKGNCVERVVIASARAYLVSPEVLGALGASPGGVQDRLSSAYMVAVCGEAIREVAALRGRAERAGKKLPTLTAQTEVRFRSAEAMSAFAAEATEALARLAAKYHDGASSQGRLFKFFLAGYPAITKREDGAPIPPTESAPPLPAKPDMARNVSQPGKRPSDFLKGTRS